MQETSRPFEREETIRLAVTIIASKEVKHTLKACGLELEMAETAVAGGEDDMEEMEEEHSVVGLDFCGTATGIA